MPLAGCPTLLGDDAVHRYVAGTLEPLPRAEFEVHLLECAACRASVREGAAIARAFDAHPRGSATARRLRWLVPAAATAGLTFWFLRPPPDPLRTLARVGDAPPFMDIPVRVGSDTATSLVDQGIAAYAAKDYSRAAELLGRAVAVGPTPGVWFYLGVARLKIDHPREALDALGQVGYERRNPYAAEADLYRAKAWLALRRIDSALARLEIIAATPGPVGAHARALADSLWRLPP
jgi:tetratricopeptide (TPR) repeat protein